MSANLLLYVSFIGDILRLWERDVKNPQDRRDRTRPPPQNAQRQRMFGDPGDRRHRA